VALPAIAVEAPLLLGEGAVAAVERYLLPVGYTHTHTFNGPLSGTTRVSRYQKGKTNLDFTEARDNEWLASAGPYASLHLAPDR